MNLNKKTPDYIWSLISDNKSDEAFKLLSGMLDGSVWMLNAMAVCQMRMGNPHKAFALLIDLVYHKNSVVLQSETSDSTKLNLATAMLMMGNVEGALSMLREVRCQTQMKANIENSIRVWKKKQSIFSRIGMMFGIYPNKKVELDFPPGQIEVNIKNEVFLH